jgi:outer membrane protein OmpA-like peptidoglycan-associated protein
MGLTMAEAFILICFALLLLLAFWQWETEKQNTPEVKAFKELTDEQRRTVLVSVQDGSIDAFVSLKKKGMDFAAPASTENPQENWRFIDQSELLRLTDAAANLPDDIQRSLADLVEAGQTQKLLQEMAILEDLVKAGQTLEGITRKIGEAESQEAALVDAIRSELGGIVSDIGGYIDETGAIILPDQVLFDQGKAGITPSLAEFMADACEPWLATLRNSGIDISEVKIEGHASSEWRVGSSPREAYLGNLDLSQRRSQAVLRTCLDLVTDPELLNWARKHLIAVGYSSARPIKSSNGKEDKTASRRVVFSAAPNRQSLLAEIESEATTARYDRSLFGGWNDLDGDCQDTRQELLQTLSAGNVSFARNNCTITRGKWKDPYTGKTFTSARDVEVDHLVPLKWAWDQGAHSWTAKKRADFVNDATNLFVVDAYVNREKGVKGPTDWLPPSKGFQCQYVTRFQQVVLKYGLELSEEKQEELINIEKQVCK